MNLKENKTEIFLEGKQKLWAFVEELYLPDQSPVYYINIVNEINKTRKNNSVFKLLSKNRVFRILFREILQYIEQKLDRRTLIFLEIESEIESMKVFFRKYDYKTYNFLDKIQKSQNFSFGIPLQPIKTLENRKVCDQKVTEFLLGLEQKQIRKNLKKIENCETFINEIIIFLSLKENTDFVFDLLNIIFQILTKAHKIIKFTSNIEEKIRLNFGFLLQGVQTLEFCKIESTKKSKNLESLILLTQNLSKELKKSLKEYFWSNFSQKIKDMGQKKIGLGEIYDESSYGKYYTMSFLEIYKKVCNYLKNDISFKIFDWIFLIYLKVFV